MITDPRMKTPASLSKLLGVATNSDVFAVFQSNRFTIVDGRVDTDCLAVYFLWSALAAPRQTIMVCSEEAGAIIGRVRDLQVSLASSLGVPLLTRETPKELHFVNETQILGRSFGPHAARGIAVNLLCLDGLKGPSSREFWDAARPSLAAVTGSCIMNGASLASGDLTSKILEGAMTKKNDFVVIKPF